ncbi:hypothetical protein, partial [Crystallibacter crystallopoietes]|uniref:hypothetical protein n=1 Tax=Crystallibacter crystallopoietes TaxID=37928 RepID=UPI001ED9A92A
PFGSGKSEIAEEWHRSAIARLTSDRSAPIPVWLYARQIGHEGLEKVIADQIGLGLLRARGVAAVIDGLDEVDGARAEEIARDARILVASNSLSSALGTARPGILPPNEDDLVVEGLHENAARQLVQELSGRQHISWDWTSELVATIRRPFFALAAAALVAAGAAPKGQAELMKSLVEQALSRASAANATASENTYDALLRMSVSLTRTNGLDDGLTFHERQLAVSTRLVTPTSLGTAKFTLPVFEQWFSAQALLGSSNLLHEALASPMTFDRWRWVIAVAVLSGRAETGRHPH